MRKSFCPCWVLKPCEVSLAVLIEREVRRLYIYWVFAIASSVNKVHYAKKQNDTKGKSCKIK
jgi:hypothetical protein